MSLRVWLPLNGNLNNQGLSDYNISMFRGTEIYNNNGKIGKCFHSNGMNTIKILNIIPDVYNYTGYSLCAWFYIEGQNSSHSGSAIISAGNWNNQLLNLSVSDWSTDHYTRLRVSGTSWNYTYSYNFLKNTWYHVVVCSDGQKTYAYVNGTLIGDSVAGFLPTSIEGNDICIGGATYYSGMQFFGRINDVRIYDHCLSKKEVEEISKGLVLHYKLNNTYINENLMPESLEMKLGSANPSTGTWRTAGTNNMTRSRVAITDTPDGNGYGFQNSGIQTANDGSCYGIDSFPMEANTVYTISMWARITEGTEGYAGFCIYSSTLLNGSHLKLDKNYYVTQLPANGDWVYCWYTFKTNTATTRNIYIGITTGSTSVTTQMCNIHLEKGELGTVVYDSSGYNRNGNYIDNTCLFSANSSKYNTSTQFNGTTSGIIIQNQNLASILSDICSISFWVKGRGDNGGRSIYFSSYNSSPFWCLEKSTGNKFRYDWNGSPDQYSADSILDDVWTHLCLVRESSNSAKFYINGEYKQTFASSTAALTNLVDTWRIGRDVRTNDGTPYSGLISDFRIYCTALTAEQVKELYDTSATIDKNGNVYAREVVEK